MIGLITMAKIGCLKFVLFKLGVLLYLLESCNILDNCGQKCWIMARRKIKGWAWKDIQFSKCGTKSCTYVLFRVSQAS